jgi:GntR family transcriptional regulator
MSDSPDIPIYLYIKEHLRQSIASGERAADSRIPSERDLAQQFGVSRMTARQALHALIQEGYAYTRTGVGTFARNIPVHHQQLTQLTSFSQEARQRGLAAHSDILSAQIIAADDDIAAQLRLVPGESVIILARLRLVGEMPLAIEISHLAAAHFPDLLTRYDFRSESLYRVLTQDYGCHFAWAEQTIVARGATPDERKWLRIKAYMPVLAMTRLTYDAEDRPIEFVRSVYRSDQYQLHTILLTTPHTAPNAYVSLQRIVENEDAS